MNKKMMQDMIPRDKRSIRQIPVERAKRSHTYEEVQGAEDDQALPSEPTSALPPEPPRFRAERANLRRWFWIGGIVVLVIILVVIGSSVFAGANMEVTPQQEQVTVNGDFAASLSPEPDELGFEVMTVTRTASREVTATGEEQVDTKASGTIIIFNDFSTETERLIKNTRFETPEGLIYRLDRSVDVPGQHENAAGETVPGSIEAVVFAETSGDAYNIGLTDFTIPGLEEANDPRFFKMYARSKTPMTGGFSGIQRTVSETDEATAREAIRQELTETVRTEAQGQVPEGFILYDDAVFVDFQTLPNENTDSRDTVRVVEQGTLRGVIFNEALLAQHIAEATVARYDGEAVRFDALDNLSMAVIDKDTLEAVSLTTVDLTLQGNGVVIWDFDEERLKDDLAGKHRREVETVLSGYPAIERAEINLRPFWRRSFPEKTTRITIEEVIGDSE